MRTGSSAPAAVLDFMALIAYASLNVQYGGGRDDDADRKQAGDVAPGPPHSACTRFSAPSLPGGSSTCGSAPRPRWCARCPWGWDGAARVEEGGIDLVRIGVD